MTWVKFVLLSEDNLWREEFLQVEDEPPKDTAYGPASLLWLHRIEAGVLLRDYDNIDWPTRKDVYCLCVGVVDDDEVVGIKRKI